MFIKTLSGLEEAYDDPEAFRAFCQKFREEGTEVVESPLVQWYLEPAECGLRNVRSDPTSTECGLEENFKSLPSDWTWHDPFEDCRYEVVGNGLKIHAANGRDLWYINLSAPRMLRGASGDFALQTVCIPALEDRPSIGGLLLWKDKQNYLRLDKGTQGKYEINFSGCIEDKDLIIGRGHLVAEGVFLRLERIGGRVNALYSADGQEWFTAGSVKFPVDALVEIGLHAIGNIDRTIYHGAYPDGTVIRFEGFELWGR